jgi:anti-sigma regulatory factor (Ser/Thr protein kinase)
LVKRTQSHKSHQAPELHAIDTETEVYQFARAAKALAKQVGFASFDCGLVSIAASEIAMNALRHAGSGIASLSLTANGKGIEICIEDRGPGIADTELAMQDGYTTHPLGLGMGLGAARRLMDELIFNPHDAAGCRITMRKYLPIPDCFADIGVVSFPAVREHINGDGYFIKGYEGDKLLVSVLDGAGKGDAAAAATKLALTVLHDNFSLPLAPLLQLCHQTLTAHHSRRGLDIALLRLSSTDAEFCGVGNIGVHTSVNHHFSFYLQNGSAGNAIPEPINVIRHPLPASFILSLHTDGITSSDFSAFYGAEDSAQAIATRIFDSYALAEDDATLLVIRRI